MIDGNGSGWCNGELNFTPVVVIGVQASVTTEIITSEFEFPTEIKYPLIGVHS